MNPVQQIGSQLQQWGSQNLGAPIQGFLQQAQQHCHTLHSQWAQSPLARLHREAVSSTLQGPWHPMLATISMGGRGGGAGMINPCQGSSKNKGSSKVLCDLAMAKDEVKARLAPIPVYTVANPKNEFVLVAGR